jgi:hypothetical protein
MIKQMEEFNYIIEQTNNINQLRVYGMLVDIRIKELNSLNKNMIVTARQAV